MRTARTIDGKAVRCWLFARLSRLSPHPVLYQVEAFTLDHAFARLTEEIAPGFRRAEFEMLEELDAEHDVGKLGSYHPLGVILAPRSFRLN